GGCPPRHRTALRLHAPGPAGFRQRRRRAPRGRARRAGARLPARAAPHPAAGAPAHGSRGRAMTGACPLPYAFAKRHGVLLLGDGDDGARIGLRGDVDADALLEARRVLGPIVAIEELPVPVFDRRLAEAYADAGLEGAVEVEALDRDGGLDAIADGIPAAEDLLDVQDDAPVIRLINGLIA